MAAFCQSVGADAIGLNFYERSVRFVDEENARKIIDATGPALLKVGLFVNHDILEVVSKVNRVGLDAVQLHGDETPESLDGLDAMPASVRVIRAIRISPQNQADALADIVLWESHPNSERVGAFLLDPFVESEFGGTGHQIDWNWLASLELPTKRPIILAGGLKSENVQQAIEIVRPFGVDVASGVESEKGRKDKNLIRDFTHKALGLLDGR